MSDRSAFADSNSARQRSRWAFGRWFESRPDPLLEMLFEKASDGFIVCTADGKVASCNPVAAQLLGQEAAAVEGHHVSDLFDQGGAERRFSLRSGAAMTRAREGSSARPVNLHLTEYVGSTGPRAVGSLAA